MASFSSLQAKFASWMCLIDISTTETARVKEVLNAAIALVLSEGVPGLQQTMSGYTFPDLPVQVNPAAAVGTTRIKFHSAIGNLNGVFVNDILTLGSETFLIRAVIDKVADGGTEVDIGLPLTAEIADTTQGTIQRRGLQLPHSGQVVAVSDANGNPLEYSPLTPAEGLYDSRKSAYTVSYEPLSDYSIVSIYPAPTPRSRFTVVQNLANADDAEYDVPDSQVYPVMIRAINLWRMVNDEQNQIVAGLTQAAVSDASDLTRNNPGAKQVMVR